MAATPMDLVETALADGRFTTLSNAINHAGLAKLFKGPGPFTIFAPTDEAFRRLPAESLEELMADKKRLAAVLSHHVLRGRFKTWDIPAGALRTLGGELVSVGATDDGMTVGDANVTAMNVAAANGILHAIDAVLLPGPRPVAPKAWNESESPWSGRKRVAPRPRSR